MSKDAPRLDPERLSALGRVEEIALSPCGTWLAVVRSRLDAKHEASYVSDLWKVPVTPGPPVQLTRGRWKDRAPMFRADGALGFLSDRPTEAPDPGDEGKPRNQVWLLSPHGGEPAPLTDEPLGVSSFRFGGDRLVVMASVLPGIPHAEQRKQATERRKRGPSTLRYTTMPVRFWDHWRPEAAPHLIAYTHEGEERVDLTPDADREHRNTTWDLSPDGALLAVMAIRTPSDRVPSGQIRLIDTHTREARTLELPENASHSVPRFSPDGRLLASVRGYRAPEACGPVGIWIHDVATGQGKHVAQDWDRWPTPWGWTPDGKRVIVTAADRGLQPVFTIDADTSEVTRITAQEAGGTHGRLIASPDGSFVVGVRHRTTHPPEPFSVPLIQDAAPTLLATLSGFGEEEGEAIAHIEELRVPSTDGFPCQNFLLTPKTASEGPHPLVLWIHGGPMSQWSDCWHWRWNPLTLLSQGYALALPNPRGSTGEGHDFINGVWGNQWGAQCYEDLMAITDALVTRDDIDETRVAAMGGSFGGYMTNWIGTQTDRFACLVTHAGIYAISMFQGVTDMPAWWTLNMGGITPQRDFDAYSRYSPARHIHNWTSPTLILHGELDYRVPVSEALALFEALQVQGVASELIIWPDENHWILKPRNIISWYNHVLRFLDQHLQGSTQHLIETAP